MSDGATEGISRPELSGLREILVRSGVEAYIVGGCVRDMLLGRPSADIDIAVRGDAPEVARSVARKLQGRYVPLDEPNQVARVVLFEGEERLYLDFSGYQGSIEDDLARRDFTIDAMALELGQWAGDDPLVHLIDPFGGRGDLEEKRLRAVAEGVFKDDAARLLRAVRLAGELGLKVDPGTESLLRRDAGLLGRVPGERVREELVRVLVLPKASSSLKHLDRLGLLLVIFPELVPARGFEQPGDHFWDVLQHSLETVATVEFLLRQAGWEYGTEDALSLVPWSEDLSRHFATLVARDSDRAAMLKLAALLHDVAKPATKTVTQDGRWRFLGHAKLGASVARAALERLRFSGREVKLVETEVYYHLRPVQMTNGDLPTRRAVYRYFRDTAGAGIDIFFLAMADYLATHGPRLDMEEWRGHARLMAHVLGEGQRQQAASAPPRLVDGHDMIDTFGMEPGPQLGLLLGRVREAQASGEVNTREEALEFIRRQLARPGTKRVK
ncbi:MAG: HD domain-containing protein [Chloroflexota bacterium]